ncbi:MAG: phenylalanine--tRNA ligase subunit beta [bacterium]|nr:phenylalanine--tRNA ligase subunit beta [bacterium]
MNISYRWLSRHVDLTGISPEELADNLTLSTAEVEGLEPFAPHMNDVVVGHVLERVQHPDADKLGVCQVDVGNDEVLNIVCGAPNVAAGQNVAVAKVGTRLPGDFKIKKSKIRGVPSFGMICSEAELELGDGHDGIWVLPEGLTPGTPVAQAMDMGDWIIEIDNKSLTHRPDLWGHRGLAGEVAAIFERELKPLDLSLPKLGDGKAFPVRVDDAACTRYLGLAIDGVKQEASPQWLQFLLMAVGQRPLDLLVDLSNFVMLDLGQPNHAFDRTQLSEQGIVVRRAAECEKMITLDEVERDLSAADLLITDGNRPVALAGIMGGQDSKIEGATDKLLLEVASFAPAVIRRTSARLGLRSDSSARFEKSLDPLLPVAAAGHFARLLLDIQPGVTFPMQLSDAGDWSDPSCSIEVRGDVIRGRLGIDLDDPGIIAILERLYLKPSSANGVITVNIPACRATKDLGMEQDIVEEVGRIYRYGNVPTRALIGAIEPVAQDPRRALVRSLQDRMAGGARFHESMGYSFVPGVLLKGLGILDEPRVSVINPVAEGVSKMRRSLTPSLLDAAIKNRQRTGEVALFEVGKGYLPESDDAKTEPKEVHMLGAVLALARDASRSFRETALARLHAVATDLLTSQGITLATPAAATVVPVWAHPKKCLAIQSADTQGYLGFVTALDPGTSVEIGFAGDVASEVAVLHICIDALLAESLTGFAYRPLPKFPEVKVDVAIQAPDLIPAVDLVTLIEKAGKGIVAGVEPFDEFRGDSLPADTRSLAFHVRLYSDTRTLTDKDSAKFLKRLTGSLMAAGAELRGA